MAKLLFFNLLVKLRNKSFSYSHFINHCQGSKTLYLEGLGFRSIGRILGVSNVSVLNRIRDFGKKIQELNAESQQTEMVEVDEMHSYRFKKTAARYGLLLTISILLLMHYRNRTLCIFN